MTTEKVREDRIRRMADRQGLKVVKSRSRDHRARDYGRYWISDLYGDYRKRTLLGKPGIGADLDEVEKFLTPDKAEGEDNRRSARGRI